jgi:hypothetical protein
LTLWFFIFYILYIFFWGIGTICSRGGTGVCFSLMEGGLGFVYSYGGTSILFFFPQLIFFLFKIWGDHGPSRSPIGPSLRATIFVYVPKKRPSKSTQVFPRVIFSPGRIFTHDNATVCQMRT